MWAHDPVAGCWWPGEVLDPHDPPAGARMQAKLVCLCSHATDRVPSCARAWACTGRGLPEGSESFLEATEKLVSLPRYRDLALSRLNDEQVGAGRGERSPACAARLSAATACCARRLVQAIWVMGDGWVRAR